MSEQTYRWAIASGAITGLFVAVAMTLAFGVFDIQCGGKGEWSALKQTCLPPHPSESEKVK